MKNVLRKSMLMLIVLSVVLTMFAGVALAANTVTGVGGSTNIRSTAGLSGKILGTFPKGATADLLASATDGRGMTWYKITYKNVTGWVSSMYTSLNGGSSFNQGTGTLWTTGRVNMRSSASLSGSIICTIPKGESVKKLGSSKTDGRNVIWYKVSWGSKTGWVSSAYLSAKSNGSSIGGVNGNTSTGSKSSSSYTKVVGSGGKSNIRSTYNLNGNVVGTLPKGATAKYLGSTKYDNRDIAWYKISYDGVTGWVSSKYTTLK